MAANVSPDETGVVTRDEMTGDTAADETGGTATGKIGHTVGKTGDEAVDKSRDAVADETRDTMADETGDTMADETRDTTAGRTRDMAVDEAGDIVADKRGNTVSDKTGVTAPGKTRDITANKIGNMPTDENEDIAADENGNPKSDKAEDVEAEVIEDKEAHDIGEMAADEVGDVAADDVNEDEEAEEAEDAAAEDTDDIAADKEADEIGEMAANFPRLVLPWFRTLIDLLPLKDVLSCAGVCRRWRIHLSSSQRWISFDLGRHIICHPDVPLRHSVFLPQLKEVKLTPINTRSDSPYAPVPTMAELLRHSCLPVDLVRTLLCHGSELQKLDLSSMCLLRDQKGFKEIWTDDRDDRDDRDDHIGENQLTTLDLPRRYKPSMEHLKAVIDKHPRLEHLTFSTGGTGIVTCFGSDLPEQLFENCESLKHLGLDIHIHISPVDSSYHQILSPIDSCNQLESLSIFHSSSLGGTVEGHKIISVLADMKLKSRLVRLHLDIDASCGDVELVLRSFPNLESVRIGRILKLGDWHPSPELADAALQHPLHSASFGLSLEGGIIQETVVRLLNMMASYTSLKDLQLFPESGHRYFPAAENFVSTVPFLEQLLEETITSIIFKVEDTQENWEELTKVLIRMTRLKKLYLVVYPGEYYEQVPLPHAGSSDLQHLHLYSGMSPNGVSQWRLEFWHNVSKLAVTCHYGTLDLRELCREIPSTWKLEEFELCRGGLSLRVDLFPEYNRLQFLKRLSILSHAQFEAGSFQTLVAACPLLESIKVDQNDFSGMSLGIILEDLRELSGWKRLKECVIEVVVYLKEFNEPCKIGELCADCESEFVNLDDADFIPNLVDEWKRTLIHLELVNIYAVVQPRTWLNRGGLNHGGLNRGGLRGRLIFASACGLGQLHFKYSRHVTAAR